jgi:predicted acylesterase/phospholipase RssA
VRIKGYTFVDGGVVTNTPLGSVIELGCNNITIILLDDEPLHPREYLDSLPDTERDVKFDSLRAIMSGSQ